MSKDLRAELERLQSEVGAVRQVIAATAARLPEARAYAKSAEDALAVVKTPLDQLAEENRGLKEQVKWENSQARPLSPWIAWVVIFIVLLLALIATYR